MMGIQPDGHGTVLFHFDIHFCPKFPGLQIPTKRNTQDLQELFIECKGLRWLSRFIKRRTVPFFKVSTKSKLTDHENSHVVFNRQVHPSVVIVKNTKAKDFFTPPLQVRNLIFYFDSNINDQSPTDVPHRGTSHLNPRLGHSSDK